MRYKFLIAFLIVSAAINAQQIPVSERQVIAYHAKDYEGGLFDEGSIPMDRSIRQAPKSPFIGSYQKLYLPLVYLVNLEAIYQLDSLLFFDGAGKDGFKISIGDPSHWQPIFVGTTAQYQQWIKIPIQSKSQFLRLEFQSPQAEIGEILLFGKKVEDALKSTQIKAAFKRKSFDEFLGINAFVDDPLDKIKEIASEIREYHNWDWHYQEGLDLKKALSTGPAFAPSPAGPWNFDKYYRKAKDLNLKIYPCIQYAPPWLVEHKEHKPLSDQAITTDPESYRWHSEFVFQYAARYGSQKLPNRKLNYAHGESLKSGLNLIDGIETWNEPDRWWRGRRGYFSSAEYAAMMSADYDGHEGKLGSKHGVKQADPNLEFIMAGITRLDTHYVEGMRLWSLYNRDSGNFPADVINFHHYSNDAGGQDGQATRGLSPEEDDLDRRLRQVVAYRNRKLPQQKIYFSEFGYDTNPNSPQTGSPKDSFKAVENQANWILRSFLLAHASGIDGAFLYMYRDVNAPNPNKFMSSGLSAEKWNKDKQKTSFHRLKSLKVLLEGFYFKKRLPLAAGLHCYLYQNEKGESRYVYWSSLKDSESPLRAVQAIQEKSGRIYSPASSSPMPAIAWQAQQELNFEACPKVLVID